jgi:hypothetical protein
MFGPWPIYAQYGGVDGMPRATPLADPVYCGGATRGAGNDSWSNSAADRYSILRLGVVPARLMADAIATVGVARNS